MKKIFLMFIAVVCFGFIVNAQTAEELKAERQALKAEMASKDGGKLEKAWKKLSEQDAPETSNVKSIDALVSTNASLIATLVATENILKEYKTEIKEQKDGEVDITKYSAKLDDYIAQLPLLVAAGETAAAAVQQVKDVQNDIKGLNPATGASAIKSGKWAISATDVNVQMIEQNTKLIKNLINSCKAAKNL